MHDYADNDLLMSSPGQPDDVRRCSGHACSPFTWTARMLVSGPATVGPGCRARDTLSTSTSCANMKLAASVITNPLKMRAIGSGAGHVPKSDAQIVEPLHWAA